MAKASTVTDRAYALEREPQERIVMFQRRVAAIQADGAEARAAGLPIEACPYRNESLAKLYRRAWLKGWNGK